ncbi:MAG: ribonuclease domain-containing protein [Casimicrobiaceae bacterium]
MAIRVRLCHYACGIALAAVFAGNPPAALARSALAELPEISAAELPREGRDTLDRIKANGRFRHERDGAVFGNRERILPPHPRGYYREYTVRTPGAKNRGARRIVCGGRTPAPATCFYSDDHYQSFSRIRE